MKKYFLSKILAPACLVSAIATPAIASVSCSRINITKIHLYLQRDNVRPGESLIVRAIVEPTYKRTQDLKWSMTNAPQGVTISHRGEISVPLELHIDGPIVVNVLAVSPSNSDVNANVAVTILPKPTLDFQGFVNDEIQHLDRDHNLVSTKIVKKSEYEYETAENIDIFEMDTHFDAPEYFTSFVYFQPIISSTVTNFMSFNIKGGPDSPHGIMWSSGYVDESWTTSIPDFLTFDPAFYFETIIVHFSCDPRITLTINFNIWQSITQHNTGIIQYIPDSVDDPHDMLEDLDGRYSCNMFCPDQETTGTYSGHIGSIYCSRPPQEYTLFNIQNFVYAKDLDPILKDALTVTVSEPTLVIRKFDHMRFYKFDVDYKFDLAKKQYPASHWHYQTLELGSIDIIDPTFKKTVPCWIDFFIGWKQ